MSWTRLPLDDNQGIILTVTKKTVTIILLHSPLVALRFAPGDRIAIELGDGEHLGWVRISIDDHGIEGEASSGRLVLSVPRSTLPDLPEMRSAPLVWRAFDNVIEVRLPTVLTGVPQKPILRSVVPNSDTPYPITVPGRYELLYREAWSTGNELIFLSDDTCLVNGKSIKIENLDAVVRPLLIAA